MSTNFEKVQRLNTCFGNPSGADGLVDWTAAGKQQELIEEEFNELAIAIKDKDLPGIRDAVADILVTTYGMAHRLGFNADEDFEKVHISNMSKLCTNSEELQATMDYYYTQIGIEVYSGGEEGAMWVKSTTDQTGHDGKAYPAHKFLKCVNWHEPSFN